MSRQDAPRDMSRDEIGSPRRVRWRRLWTAVSRQDAPRDMSKDGIDRRAASVGDGGFEQCTAIAVDQLWKYYGDYPALRDCTLQIAEGSCCALLGRNGAGKTTLLRILAGLSHFQRGSVKLFGAPPRAGETRRRTGFLGHGIGVYEDLSAEENLRFFARIGDIGNVAETVNSWLKRVGLDRVAAMPVRQFSRGMRQRLALARAFLNTPNILLLDEPFTSLDDRAIAMLSELLIEARQRNATIVLSTHQLREALAIASHVALIENGRLRYTGERTREMLDDPALLYRLHTELGAA